MKRAFRFALGALLFSSLLVASPSVPGKGRLRCTLTNTKVEKCCCQQKGEKLYCPLAKKTIEKCCCKPVEEGR